MTPADNIATAAGALLGFLGVTWALAKHFGFTRVRGRA